MNYNNIQINNLLQNINSNQYNVIKERDIMNNYYTDIHDRLTYQIFSWEKNSNGTGKVVLVKDEHFYVGNFSYYYRNGHAYGLEKVNKYNSSIHYYLVRNELFNSCDQCNGTRNRLAGEARARLISYENQINSDTNKKNDLENKNKVAQISINNLNHIINNLFSLFIIKNKI